VEVNRLVEKVLEQPVVYRLWQAWHEDQKFAPVLRHNDLSRVRRVLDVGCGPGMNTALFSHAEYLGIDINPKYIESARRRFDRKFVVADATVYTAPPNERFDFILVNSFLHHIHLQETRRVLTNLVTLLTGDGHLHSIELVMPGEAGLERALARWDRGRFARPLAEWEEIFSQVLEPIIFEPFTVRKGGLPFWQLVYFKGKAKP
jgi:SAM-dependent methyltransferase